MSIYHSRGNKGSRAHFLFQTLQQTLFIYFFLQTKKSEGLVHGYVCIQSHVPGLPEAHVTEIPIEQLGSAGPEAPTGSLQAWLWNFTRANF